MADFSFNVDCRCPARLEYKSPFATSAVNSVVICTGFGWENTVKSLIEQAHIRSCMPSYTTCVTDMLRANGFTPVYGIKCAEDLAHFHKKNGDPTDKYIIRIKFFGYCAVIPHAEGKGYYIKGIRKSKTDIDAYIIDACWKYVPGTDNRTGIKKKGFEWSGNKSSDDDLTIKNLNPKNLNIGDCAVRALCAAMEVTWDEAIDLLIKASRYTDPVINTIQNITNALIDQGFERRKALHVDGRLLSGKQFCKVMTHTFHNGERIFAYVGSSHCAAILPFVDENGKVKYKTQDSWNSNKKLIGDFWIIMPRTRREKAASQKQHGLSLDPSLMIGSTINHPTFGQGVIISDSGEVLTIEFVSVGIKHFSKEWLIKAVNEQ